MPVIQQPEDLLRERREALGLTQEDLASIANISRGTVRNAEAGKPLSDRSRRALEDALAIRLPDPFGLGNDDVLPLDVARPLLGALAGLFASGTNDEQAKKAASALREVVAAIAAGRDVRAQDLAELMSPLAALAPSAAFKRTYEYLRDYLAPEESPTQAPRLSSVHRSGAANISAGGAVAAAEPSQEPLGDISPDDMASAEGLADQMFGETSRSDVSLRWLGDGVNLGIIQLNTSVPVGPVPVRLLTREDLRVISDTVEALVAQMAKTLAWARSRAERQKPTHAQVEKQVRELQGDVEKQVRELQDEVRFGWERQLHLVADLHRAGVDVDVIAKSIGETPKGVTEMLQQASVMFRKQEPVPADPDSGGTD